MIVPQNRLLIWLAVVVLPFAALPALLPEMLPLAVSVIVLLILMVLLDAVLGVAALDGLRVELPEVVRLAKDRAGEIEIHLHNESKKPRPLRLGLPLPRELDSEFEDLLSQLPAEAEHTRVHWSCTPRRRGNFNLDRCHVESASPFGFWAFRRAVPVRCELRVYPNLLTERKSVAALFLNRGALGLHAVRQVGKGRDFEKLRDYVPGDSFDDVHWKASAKRGRPITKVFQIERTQEVYVIIDASRLSAREATPAPGAAAVPGQAAGSQTALERFITSGLMLALAAEQQGDHFGLLTFSDRVLKFVRAKNGREHYTACRDALYALQPQQVTPDYDELSAFIRVRLRRRALLVFLTSLDDPVLAESFVKNMDLICRQHLILVNMLQPAGTQPVFGPGEVNELDDLYEKLGGHLQWQRLRELQKVLQHRGVTFSLLNNEKLSAQLVTQYLAVKRRQLI